MRTAKKSACGAAVAGAIMASIFVLRAHFVNIPLVVESDVTGNAVVVGSLVAPLKAVNKITN